jgi:uncharacterized protein (TIRG00374 family)
MIYLIHWVGTRQLLEHARNLRGTFLVLLAIYGGVNLLRTLSWKICLQEESRKLTLRSALNLWLAGEAVSHLSFAWSGDAFRATVLRDRIGLGRGLSALLVSRMAYFYASMVVVVSSLAAAALILPQEGLIPAVLGGGTVVFGVLLMLPFTGAGVLQKEFRPLHNRLERFGPETWIGRLHHFFHTFTGNLETVFVQDRSVFWRLLIVNLAASLIGVLEVYLVLRVLSPTVTLPQALVIEGGTKVLSMFSFLVPGNVGVREGGVVLLLELFALGTSVGVALALVRRARALFWVAVGGMLMTWQGIRPRSLENRGP